MLSVCVTAYSLPIGSVGQVAIALTKTRGSGDLRHAGIDCKSEQLRALGVKGAFDSHSFD